MDYETYRKLPTRQRKVVEHCLYMRQRFYKMVKVLFLLVVINGLFALSLRVLHAFGLVEGLWINQSATVSASFTMTVMLVFGGLFAYLTMLGLLLAHWRITL